MDESRFKELLAENKVVIVHFSHYAVMNHRVEFPDDLEHAIDFYQSESRSCCAIRPRHNMDLPGAVGVIFRPTFEQVLSVFQDDSGSYNLGGSENSRGNIPSEETILASFNVPPSSYNEWRVKGAQPCGIFVNDINNICVKKRCKLHFNGKTIDDFYCKNIALTDVIDAFPNMQIFTMGLDGVIRISNGAKPCSQTDSPEVAS